MVDHEGHQFHGHLPFLRLQTSSFLVVPQWNTQSIFGLTGAMLAAVAASVTYECLNEYLLHLKRVARRSEDRSECGGVPVVTCREKLGQTIVQVMRVIFGYFLMLCVMTMNVWLLTSVVVGAFVGYGVGKPIVANSIHDSVTSYGFESAAVGIFRRGNRRSEVSRSWKFQAVSDAHMQFEQTGALLSKPNNTQNADRLSTGSDVVWLRRSSEDIPSATSTDRIQKDRDKDDPAESLGASNFDSINSEGTGSSRSFSRFRSTSKVINDSFRSQRSYSQLTKQSSNASVFTQESPQLRPKHLQASRTSSKVSRASSTSSGRFKPVSKQIRRQMSFNDDSG